MGFIISHFFFAFNLFLDTDNGSGNQDASAFWASFESTNERATVSSKLENHWFKLFFFAVKSDALNAGIQLHSIMASRI